MATFIVSLVEIHLVVACLFLFMFWPYGFMVRCAHCTCFFLILLGITFLSVLNLVGSSQGWGRIVDSVRVSKGRTFLSASAHGWLQNSTGSALPASMRDEQGVFRVSYRPGTESVHIDYDGRPLFVQSTTVEPQREPGFVSSCQYGAKAVWITMRSQDVKIAVLYPSLLIIRQPDLWLVFFFFNYLFG